MLTDIIPARYRKPKAESHTCSHKNGCTNHSESHTRNAADPRRGCVKREATARDIVNFFNLESTHFSFLTEYRE